MLIPTLALIAGLVVLVLSAERFVAGSAATARSFGVSPLLIGMGIIGFGTSFPEMLVSVLAARDGSPGLALGNAYGSNVANIALILGITALVRPITVHSKVLRRELPVLIAVTGLAAWQLRDHALERAEGWTLLGVFGLLGAWTVVQSLRRPYDPLGTETEEELASHPMSRGRAITWALVGLLFLLASSRAVVWGAVEIARALGVGELVLGLTVVAVGTSLPELASSLVAARRGEDDLAIGNVIGSNLFNTLVVVGLAVTVRPAAVDDAVLHRDLPVMGGLTVCLFLLGFGLRGRMGRVNRIEGALLVTGFVAYTAVLVKSALAN